MNEGKCLEQTWILIFGWWFLRHYGVFWKFVRNTFLQQLLNYTGKELQN